MCPHNGNAKDLGYVACRSFDPKEEQFEQSCSRHRSDVLGDPDTVKSLINVVRL